MKKLLKTPFASALAGGLVVAVLGLVALGTGLVDAGGESTTTTTTVPASAPETALASDAAGKALTVNQIYSQDSPGVVYITAQQKAQPTPFNPFGQSQGGTATGSGFVIDNDGHILTNNHVVAGSDNITVRVGGEDGQTMDATVVGADPSTDVAVLKVDNSDQLQPLELGSSSGVKVGDPVVAIGNPFGLDRTATAGIVSAVQRQIDAPNGFTIENAIQTDAPINPGNSGGPLLDAEGKVIGINSQIESGGQSEGNVGIGFAVPIDTAQEIAQQLISNGSVEHAYMGISGGDLTPEIADVLNLDANSGALVQAVVPNSPADKAGIQAGDATVTVGGARVRAGGDVITAVDGNPVSGMDDVIAAVDAKQPGDSLQLTLLRGGDTRNVTVELAERPAHVSG